MAVCFEGSPNARTSVGGDRGIEERFFGKSQVRITIKGEPYGGTIAYSATASIKGEPVKRDDGQLLELTGSSEEQAFERMAKALAARLGAMQD